MRTRILVVAFAAVTATLVAATSCKSDGDKSAAASKGAPELADRAPPVDRSNGGAAPAERPEPPSRPEPVEHASGGGGGHGW